jgi:hypothetical protein
MRDKGLWNSNIWDSLYSKIRDLLTTKSLKKIVLLWINCGNSVFYEKKSWKIKMIIMVEVGDVNFFIET